MKAMNKNIIFCFIILSVIFSFSCKMTKEDDKSLTLQEQFDKQFKGLYRVYYEKGNFTNSDNDEYIVFYKDVREAERIKKEPDWGKTIEKVAVFLVRSNKIIKLYNINDGTIEYDQMYLKIIQDKDIRFGKWNGYCYIDDFNENGFDEIMFFFLSGMSFSVGVYEYQNNKIVNVLPRVNIYSNGISKVSTDTVKKTIKVYGSGGEKIPENQREWYEFKWNKDKGMYEVIDQGLEVWDWKN